MTLRSHCSRCRASFRSAVVVIEHDIDFLRDFASAVTVLHEGRVLCEGSVAEVQSNPRVQEVYLGRNKSQSAAEAV